MPRPPRIDFPDAVYHVTSRGNGRAVALPGRTVPIEEIDAAVARHYGIEVEKLQAHGQSAGMAKVVAVELACQLTGLTQRAIGLHYGAISSATVSTIHRKVREGGPTRHPRISNFSFTTWGVYVGGKLNNQSLTLPSPKLGLVIINACYSQNGAGSLKSSIGIAKGHLGIHDPSNGWSWLRGFGPGTPVIHPKDVLKPGNQGTRE
jgi:hypothetical protein